MAMVSSQPERNEGLSQNLTAALKKKIAAWDYPPGYWITEEDICREFSVSRSPVRECLKTLEADGYIKKQPRKGYQIVQLNSEQTCNLYDVRLALELFVIDAVTTAGLPPGVYEELKETWSKERIDEVRRNGSMARIDKEFHERLAGLINNETLLRYLKSIDERLDFFREIEFSSNANLERSFEQHNRIIDGIQKGSIEEARKALNENIQFAKSNVEKAIKEALSKAVWNQ